MQYPWAMTITYMDEANNQFLTLGGAAWATRHERDANLAHIPAALEDTPFILDIESARGIEDDRLITAETVERLLRTPIAILIAMAEREAKLEAARDRRRAARIQARLARTQGVAC